MEARTVQSMGNFCLVFKYYPALIFIFGMAFPTFVFSQNKAAEKANAHFKLAEYTPAAIHYEEAIDELKAKGKSSRHLLNLRTKLAFCHRANNRMEEAEELYAMVVSHERARPKTYLYYGETLMANGKYDQAKHWFLRYQQIEKEDERVPLLIRSCEEVKHIEPYFKYVDIQPFPHNSESDDNAPVVFGGGIVFSSDRPKGKIKVNILEEKSGWTGRGYLNIYFSEKNMDGNYDAPKPFSGKLSELNKNTGNASFTLDGSKVFFTRNDNVLNKKKEYSLQIFQAENEGGKWRNVKKLDFCSPSYNYMHPAISPDGKMLFFTANKGNGQGGTDLWVSTLGKNGKWGQPENLGPNVNTPANEGFPFMDHYGRLYFCSKGHLGFGGFDIFFTEMTGGGQWKKPVNLGQPINSSLDDISIYVAGGQKSGMFSSSRSGGDDDIFLFAASDIPPPVLTEKNESDNLIPQDDPIPVSGENMEVEKMASENEQPREMPETNTSPQVEENEMATDDPEPTLPITTEETIVEQPDQIVKLNTPSQIEENEMAIDATPVPVSTEKPKKEEVGEAVQSEINENVSPVAKARATEQLKKEESSDSTSLQPDTLNNMKKEVPQGLSSFQQFLKKAGAGKLREGERFRVDHAVFDPQIWQLTPTVSKKLDEIVGVLQRFPNLKLELSSHTETLGLDKHNLHISKKRAETAVEYMVREGIVASRLSAVGHGEQMLLNHCDNGVPCSRKEHRFNQRLEVKVISLSSASGAEQKVHGSK